MGYWDSNGIKQCRTLMEESGKRLQVLADTCMADSHAGFMSAQESSVLAGTYERTMRTAGFMISLVDALSRIQKIYDGNEQKIADYFDLAAIKAPRTELGISTFESLSGHEAQMPFER